MKITRERKIIGAILALAMVGFGVDRAMTGPQTASADSIEEPLLLASGDASNKTISNFAMNSAMNGTSGESLAERLAQLASETQAPTLATMRDVFRPGAGWVANGATSALLPSDANNFGRQHHLIAVSVNGQGGGAANVDGKLVRIGGMLDGFKLESLAHQSATFSGAGGARVMLKVRVN